MRQRVNALSAVLATMLIGYARAEYEASYSEMMDWGRNDYYGMLGVKPEIGDKELGRFYRKLTLKLHPDKNPGKESEVKERFAEVAAAYAVLKQPERRAAYDKFFMSIPASFRPKFDDKPIMEVRTLVIVCVTVISVLQYLYWSHRRQQIIDLMMSDVKWKARLAKARKEGKTVKITGADPAKATETVFFTIPMIPLFFFPWFYHLCRWLVEQSLLGREMSMGETKYWLMRQHGWEEQEYDDWLAEREAYIAKQGGEEIVKAQEKFKQRKYAKMMAKYQSQGATYDDY